MSRNRTDATRRLVPDTADPIAARMASRPVEYPAIHADGRVTFRLDAPEAAAVTLRNTTGGLASAAWPEGESVAMTKDGAGVWTVTIGPVPPEFYTYAFFVDGLNVLDPENPLVTRDGPGYRSRLEIPGERTANYAYREVPHGTLSRIYVPYPSLGIEKRTLVYTPPGYEHSDESFPALYLQHGGGGDEEAWTELGRVPEIMDNLIAQRLARPMIVVMSNIYFDQVAARDYIPVVPAPGIPPDPMIFPKALVADLVPHVEASYRARADPAYRAVAGLSRGGIMSFAAAFDNIDMFDWVGTFAAAWSLMPGLGRDIPPPPDADDLRGPEIGRGVDRERMAADYPAIGPEANETLRLLYVGVGEKDGLISAHRDVRDLLRAKGVEFECLELPGFGHEWPYWRVAFQDFVRRIFR